MAKEVLVSATLLLLMAGTGAAATSSSHKTKKHSASSSSTRSSSTKTAGKKSKHAKTKSVRHRGQQGIQADRAREIQQALIREHYLDGQASGAWDARSKAAMEKYQADHGWQTKVVPDSRALIKLGLGPDHSNILNPDTAAVPASSLSSSSLSNSESIRSQR